MDSGLSGLRMRQAMSAVLSEANATLDKGTPYGRHLAMSGRLAGKEVDTEIAGTTHMAKASESFLEAINRVGEYLHRDVRYTWCGLGAGKTPPLESPCIVACEDESMGKGISMPDYSTRALAYARLIDGEVVWFGVTHGLQEAEELRGIAFFVAIEDANRILHRGMK